MYQAEILKIKNYAGANVVEHLSCFFSFCGKISEIRYETDSDGWSS
jgi:hypothetical protein